MEFNQNELHTMNNLTFYIKLAIIVIIASFIGVVIELHSIIFTKQVTCQFMSSCKLIGTLLTISGTSYLMVHYLKLINKLLNKSP